MDKYMTVRGPLTATTVVIGCDRVARHMRDDILGAVAGEPRDLVIDLRQVGQLSSTGLAALVGVRARQRARMKTLTLVLWRKLRHPAGVGPIRDDRQIQHRDRDASAMVMVNAGGWRVEKVTRTVCDQIPVASLRISWHGYWQADCRTTAEVAEFVDLSTLVPEVPQKWMRAPVRARWQSASELLGVRVQSTIPSHQLTEVTLGR